MERPVAPQTSCDSDRSAPREAKKESLSVLTESSLTSTSRQSRPAVLSTLSMQSASYKELHLEKEALSSHQPVITAPVLAGEVPDRLRMLSLISLEERVDAEAVGRGSEPPQSPEYLKEKAGDVKLDSKLVDKECFPMGCCETTLYERGWLDIACGPSISIKIEYSGHHHNPAVGQHTPLLPNQLHIDIEAPAVLLRVFGCLARDLLALKVI